MWYRVYLQPQILVNIVKKKRKNKQILIFCHDSKHCEKDKFEKKVNFLSSYPTLQASVFCRYLSWTFFLTLLVSFHKNISNFKKVLPLSERQY